MNNFKTELSLFSMVASLAIFVSLSGSSAYAGSKLCKVDHYHFGVGSVQSDVMSAKRDAVRAWESFTAFEYGAAWGHVSQSMEADMKCTTARGGYSCRVKAKPCRDERIAQNEETTVEKVIALFQR